ncbi:MAG: hypothetical protein WA629_10550 [Candidatus Aquilonibacter sp.]
MLHSFLFAVLSYGYLVVNGTNPQVTPAVNPVTGPCVAKAQGQNLCSGSGSWSIAPNVRGPGKGYCQLSMWPSGDIWEARFTVNKENVCTLQRVKPNLFQVTIKN